MNANNETTEESLDTDTQRGFRHGWPIDLNAIRSPPSWIANPATAFLFLLIGALLAFSLIAIGRLCIDLIGDDHARASEATRTLLPLAAAIVGFPLIIWRLVILSQQTRISETKTQIDRETHYTSIFSKSVEQLGQTRELKETRENEGTSELITRTTPNIEVRLGGIHSLTRLAEESARDVEKIENMLLSYVRENSWSDREGFTVRRVPHSSPSAFDWKYSYRRGEKDEETENALAVWRQESEKEAVAQTNWSSSISETRVDVNEAIDAIARVRTRLTGKRRNRFYECLFVGRVFDTQLLATSSFQRCSFVRCRFDLSSISRLVVLNSTLIGCSISAKYSHMYFFRSHIIQTNYNLDHSKFASPQSDLYRINFNSSKSATIDFSSTDVLRSYISKDEEILTIDAKYSSLSNVSFGPSKFSEQSNFLDSALDNVSVRGCDLTAVTDISDEALSMMTADPLTRHPDSLARPLSWPAYDPNYEEEEIPF